MNARLIKLILQGIISLATLGGGFYLIAAQPDLREWGCGMIAYVIGYWTR